MLQFEWIDPKIRKPEGEFFWALTKGTPEIYGTDWIIIRIFNDEDEGYLSLDNSNNYWLLGSNNSQCWYNTIFAWALLESIPINDAQIESFYETK